MSEDWRSLRLADVAERTSIKNTRGHDRVMTVSAERGLVRQEEFFTKRVASADLGTYSVIEPGDFVYNKSRAKGAPWGVVAKLGGVHPAVVTPLYFTFRPRVGVVLPGFLLLACNSSAFFDGLSGSLREGSRAHGLLNVRLGEFFGTKIAIPPLDVQRRITDVALALDRQVKALQQEAVAAKLALTAAYDELAKLPRDMDFQSVVQIARSGGTPNRKRQDFFGGEVPWLKSGEVSSPWITETSESITASGLAGSSAWLVPADSTVVAMYGATAAQVGYLGSPMATNQAVLALRADPRLTTDRFIYHWMSSRAPALKEMASGAAQPNLSKTLILRESGFPSVTLDEQEPWVLRLDALTDVVKRLGVEVAAATQFRAATIDALMEREIEVDPSYDLLLDRVV